MLPDRRNARYPCLGGPLSELGEGQNVSVGIGEPRDAIPARTRPHALSVLVHTFVSCEHNAEGFEPADGLAHISHSPAEHGVAGVSYLGYDGDAEHRAVSVEH